HNYAMPKGHATPDSTQLLGQWRIEVSPKNESAEDYFLHLIQAGDLSLGRMVDSGLIRDGSQVGVRFTDGSKAWEVLFGTKGDASGHITITENGKKLVDRDLTKNVEKQTGLFGGE
ncbi:MAG: hypothetical protein JXB48_11305, partial [Candidatus Latescibacteria bacterium]|nr:hypothetical protein [Candidatus Latescibacterota bacterium]